ncbi:MAG: 3-isopropylmalate dehydrogenase [Thaumarchaeota archaeon]|nr:3-isopropylmalate dehydrogenase [Nitrososphaerota archaeon]|tara:strand:- start:16265 stop:17290 length:1026 start_codon:yes stop_codon:yes gene_type:complete
MKYKISVISGDGIGPEITKCSIDVIKSLENKLDIEFELVGIEAGDSVLKNNGIALSESSIENIKNTDACLKAPVGESAMEVIVKLRQLFDLYVNLRPAKSFPTVKSLEDNIDIMIVRENTEDLYKGQEFRIGDKAIALRTISEKASTRIAKYAFDIAKSRNKKVTAVHKSNVLKMTDGLFSECVNKVAKNNKDIKFSELYVDACAMNLIRNPKEFDVIVTTNMFGDILSDEAAQIIGGLGLTPSANIGDDFALFEPVHGAAPDIAGKNIANPIAIILSIKMMMEWLYSTKEDKNCLIASEIIQKAVENSLEMNIKSIELGGESSTSKIGSHITNFIKNYNL